MIKQEYLQCDTCGVKYRDIGSINMAKASQHEWAKRCERDGVKARGMMPCPDLSCKGELCLKTV